MVSLSLSLSLEPQDEEDNVVGNHIREDVEPEQDVDAIHLTPPARSARAFCNATRLCPLANES